MYMKRRKNQKSQNKLNRKNKVEGLTLRDFKTYYKDIKSRQCRTVKRTNRSIE